MHIYTLHGLGPPRAVRQVRLLNFIHSTYIALNLGWCLRAEPLCLCLCHPKFLAKAWPRPRLAFGTRTHASAPSTRVACPGHEGVPYTPVPRARIVRVILRIFLLTWRSPVALGRRERVHARIWCERVVQLESTTTTATATSKFFHDVCVHGRTCLGMLMPRLVGCDGR